MTNETKLLALLAQLIEVQREQTKTIARELSSIEQNLVSIYNAVSCLFYDDDQTRAFRNDGLIGQPALLQSLASDITEGVREAMSEHVERIEVLLGCQRRRKTAPV